MYGMYILDSTYWLIKIFKYHLENEIKATGSKATYYL